jgi:hypothetical protein
LSKNRNRLDYGKAKRGDYPLGSGAIESTNKFICHTRLKRSGAWWEVENANNILKLRCAQYNNKYDENFSKYEQKQEENKAESGPRLRLIK